jgi:hygromycin-B 7''-O-kinase
MAGLVPAIHALKSASKNVDARDKPGHDERKVSNQPQTYSAARLAAFANFFSTRSRLSFDR